MNRRDFLKSLGAASVLVPATTFAQGLERVANEAKIDPAIKAQKLATYMAKGEGRQKIEKQGIIYYAHALDDNGGLVTIFGPRDERGLIHHAYLRDEDVDGRVNYGLAFRGALETLPAHIKRLDQSRNRQIGLMYNPKKLETTRALESAQPDWGHQLFQAMYEHALDTLISFYERK